uniref:hypothetical protein n=1 Tax=Paractinoplanes polyasparticus TaxID=2856853 RepID=UPI001C844C0A|nr:hypothetical protein [Actinoplanes polyasparticus]
MSAVLVLMTAGMVVAAAHGSSAGIVVVVIVGTLVISYVARHNLRSRHVYRRRV